MAGLLDSLLLNLDRQTAPEQRPFSLQNFMTDAGQMGNVLARNEERQRQNSLRRLIEQRESEGFGYDQLSNEAAKYDMDAANAMRREFRDSYQFNQKQSDVELQRYKREMADYWFGEVLRRAQLAGLGPAELKEVCFEAAGLIAPYDSELAYRLLMQSEKIQGRDDKMAADLAKRQAVKKDIKDHESIMRGREISISKMLTDPEAAIDIKLRKELENEASRIRYIMNHLASEQYPVYSWMSAYLRGRSDWSTAVEEIKNALDLDNWDRSRATHPYNVNKLKNPIDDTENENGMGQVDVSTASTNTANNNYVKSDIVQGDEQPVDKKYKYVTERKSSYSGGTIKDVIDDIEYTATTDIQDAYERESIRDLERIKAAMNQATNANKGLNLKELQDVVDDHIKEIKAQAAELRSLGVASPEDKMKQFKNIFGTRASMDLIRQLRNFHVFTSGYYSNSPLTVLDNGLMVATPQFKPTDAQYKTAKNLHGMSSWTSAKSVLKNMNVPFLSKWADYDNEYDAIFALAKDVEQQVAGVWAGLTDGMNLQQKAEMKRFFKNNFALDDRDFAIMEGRVVFETNSKKYDRYLEDKENKRANKPTFDADGNIVGGDGAVQGKYTTKSWEDFE